jgi:hypothetical protein
MDQEPGGQYPSEFSLTERVLKEVSQGRPYLIDLGKMDHRSLVEFRRLLRDLDDRNKTKLRHSETAR